MYLLTPIASIIWQNPVSMNSSGSHISFKGKSSHVTRVLLIENDPSPVIGLYGEFITLSLSLLISIIFEGDSITFYKLRL